MKSKITIEVNFSNNNQPVIEIFRVNTDGETNIDVRDKLIDAFLDKLKYNSNWARVDWVNNHVVDGKTIHQRIHITPIGVNELEKESALMLSATKTTPPLNQSA